jgi:prepilin-type N-terminal cleavage/methylation domain-containing protein
LRRLFTFHADDGIMVSPCSPKNQRARSALEKGAPVSRLRRGFSLVELLVVLGLVVVLVGILLPAVLGVRESAQRSACSAKQVRLALGISRFNAAKEYLPGAREGTATWFATIRPYMDGNETAAMCPAGMKVTTISNWLTYGINAGTYFTSASSSSIHDGALISNQGTTRKSLDDIRVRDGLSTTWLTGDSMSHKVGKNDVCVRPQGRHSWLSDLSSLPNQ